MGYIDVNVYKEGCELVSTMHWVAKVNLFGPRCKLYGKQKTTGY